MIRAETEPHPGVRRRRRFGPGPGVRLVFTVGLVSTGLTSAVRPLER
jgi:hypothetical protein